MPVTAGTPTCCASASTEGSASDMSDEPSLWSRLYHLWGGLSTIDVNATVPPKRAVRRYPLSGRGGCTRWGRKSLLEGPLASVVASA